MFFRAICSASLLLVAFANVSVAQEPPKEMERFKADVGTWDAEIRMWVDPTDPNAKPDVTKGTETNVMLGGMWLVSHFKGEMMGMPFEGSSQMGFNPETKKYAGTWIDSMSPYPMAVEATWDEKSQTLNQTGVGKDPMGNEMKMKMTTVYSKDGGRLFTIYAEMPDGKSVKAMEISYTKSKSGDAKPPAK